MCQLLADLHTHTTVSDGLLTPQELVQRAANCQVNELAITDHDSTAGIKLAEKDIIINRLSINLIPGVEISTLWKDREIHIVGLNIDIKNHMLCDLLALQKKKRQDRAKRIALNLSEANILNVWEGVNYLANGASITRRHFASYLVEQGYAKEIGQAFRNYLAIGKVGYVCAQWCTISQAISVIHLAGGMAVIAHPKRYRLSEEYLKCLLTNFKSWGGDAIEVSHCRQSSEERKILANYANQYQLLSSQGSDFHQPFYGIDLGYNLWLPNNCSPIWQAWRE